MMKEKSKMVQKLDSSAMDTQALEQDLRAQSRALCAKLVTAHGQEHDDALRQDIADIAAGMLVLTATREGAASPIPALLKPALLEKRDDTAAPAKGKLIEKVQAMAPELIKL